MPIQCGIGCDLDGVESDVSISGVRKDSDVIRISLEHDIERLRSALDRAERADDDAEWRRLWALQKKLMADLERMRKR